MLSQPSLCCHAVLTMSEGVSLVTGREAQDLKKVDVGRRTFISLELECVKELLKEFLKKKLNRVY